MIERYQQEFFHKVEYIFDKQQDDKHQAVTEVFEFLTKEPLFAVLLTENGTKEIQSFLRHKLQVLLVDSLQERYGHRIFWPKSKETIVLSTSPMPSLESVKCGLRVGKKKARNKWQTSYKNAGIEKETSVSFSILFL